MCDWRPDIVDRAARIKDLQRELDAARASLADLAEMEVMAGRARRVRDDGEVCAKRNVEFLRVVESGEAVWWHRGRFVTRDGRARWRPLPRKSDGQFRTPTEDFPQGGANVFLLDPA